ncbi:hypothetical protein RB653_009577 [Dictyostelium firmibasis]|uniref:Sm domain-containing protein n=1 Tax=Dictyostelium firmibasis TaxID=79012 RepID=A0AAN7YQA3_9MYCE
MSIVSKRNDRDIASNSNTNIVNKKTSETTTTTTTNISTTKLEHTKKKKKFVAKEFQSLLCVFTALRGTQITIQLRSNCEIYGTIVNVDAFLNIELSNATLTNRFNKKENVQEILIQSRNIRFIQIPDKIDLNSLLYLYSKQLSQSKKKYERTMRKAPSTK